MKAKQTVLMLGLLVALPALAADQQTTNVTATATANIAKTQIQPTYPAAQYKLETQKEALKDQNKILRYEGLSSQAWTTIATRRSDSSKFHDVKEHEPTFCLFSFGHAPW